MNLKDYTVDIVCGDHPDDPSVDDWYVEISKLSGTNSCRSFCEMRKRDGKIFVELYDLGADESFQHNYEDLMTALTHAKEAATNL